MLRLVALALLGLAAISQPLTLLCDFHCASMVSAPSQTIHLRAAREEDAPPCCADEQLVARDSSAKPQSQFVAVGHAPQTLSNVLMGLADSFRSVRPSQERIASRFSASTILILRI